MEDEHYYTEDPKSKYIEYLLEINVRGAHLNLKSATSIFSSKEIDFASELLAQNMQLPEKGKILDLGCGYGFIGLTAAKLCQDCKVILTDINRRAVMLTKENIKLNKIKNAEATQGNVYGPVKDEKFDAILLNPPMVAGRKVVLQMIHQAPEHLNKGGSLQIVARKSKGGEYLFNEMKKIFSKTEVLAKSGGFWVVKGIK